MHRDMESRDRSGLTVIAAAWAGRVTVLGSIVYRAVMRAPACDVLDPSDRLGRLCDLPRVEEPLALHQPHARAAAVGCGPYRVVADPKREHYDTDTEYQREISAAPRSTRRSLMRDVLESFIKPKLLDDAGGVAASVPSPRLEAGGAGANLHRHRRAGGPGEDRGRELETQLTRDIASVRGRAGRSAPSRRDPHRAPDLPPKGNRPHRRQPGRGRQLDAQRLHAQRHPHPEGVFDHRR
ncbi:hypothetical protein QJS66_23510 (plasmid) [Kocuria rhizophila]|nr:hypothetical protein QJS66_23510 [Kocuria rhizophila]